MHQSPPLYIPLPTPEEMSRWDSKSETLYGIPSLLLMENAAQTAFRELKRCASPRPGTRILIIAGKGNTGGDGFALGRILHDDGYTVTVYSVARLETLPSPAKEHAEVAKAIGVRVSEPERACENAIKAGAYEPERKVF